MAVFENDFSDEDLIKQTVRYVSSIVETWKRGLIYSYTREFHKEKYVEEDSTDPYLFTRNGEEIAQFCVLWYDGPRIFESYDKKMIMIQKDEHSQLEQFTISHMSYSEYDKITLDEIDKKTLDTILLEKGVKTEEVYIKYTEMVINDWNDDLFDINPELFI